jgi:hypothetical protein
LASKKIFDQEPIPPKLLKSKKPKAQNSLGHQLGTAYGAGLAAHESIPFGTSPEIYWTDTSDRSSRKH